MLVTLSNGLVSGLILASVAAGFVLIFSATDILNFAQAQYVLIGAYAFVTYGAHAPVVVAAIGACLTVGILGVLTYVLAIRPMVGQPLFATVILTVAVGNILTNAAGIIWGPVQRSVPNFFSTVKLAHFLGLSVTNTALVCSILILVFFGCLAAILKWTRIGIVMRATAENPTLAGTLGVSVAGIYAAVWLTAGIGAAVAGVSFAQQNGLSLGIGDLGLLAFPVLIVGGLDSLGGALVGGLIVGVLDAIIITYASADAQFAVTYAFLLLVIIIRPSGLFGSTEVRRI